MTAREIDFLAQLIRDEVATINRRLDALGARLSPLEIERERRIGAEGEKATSALTRKERWALIFAVAGMPLGFLAQIVIGLITKTAPTH